MCIWFCLFVYFNTNPNSHSSSVKQSQVSMVFHITFISLAKSSFSYLQDSVICIFHCWTEICTQFYPIARDIICSASRKPGTDPKLSHEQNQNRIEESHHSSNQVSLRALQSCADTEGGCQYPYLHVRGWVRQLHSKLFNKARKWGFESKGN